jgi:Ethanolamine utilization protein
MKQSKGGQKMDISKIIMFIMVGFMSWGVIDKVFFNNRFGYGEKFDEGINSMGPMAAAMVGFMCLAPVMGKILTPLVTPFFNFFHADAAMLSGTLLSMDMGGYPLAQEMTSNPEIAIFAGGIYGAVMGPTITFSIPVALGMLKKEDHKFLSTGVMIGVIVAPFACLVGGVMMGLPFMTVLQNLSVSFILALLLSLGLWKFPDAMMTGFTYFSKVINVIVYASLAAAIIEGLTGIVVIPGMAPIGPQLEIVGIIGITLAGAYPFVHFIISVAGKGLKKIGDLLGVNEATIAGMFGALANSLLLLDQVDKMDNRGKVMALAFMMPAAFVFGDHLAYASANVQPQLVPIIVSKLLGGVLAVIIVLFTTKKGKEEK